MSDHGGLPYFPVAIHNAAGKHIADIMVPTELYYWDAEARRVIDESIAIMTRGAS